MPFVIHEADEGGWEPYGYGTVSEDGSRIVPSRYARLRELTGSGNPFNMFLAWAQDVLSALFGDPVDAASGLFAYQKTDLLLPGPVPIELTRFYRQQDVPPGSTSPNTYMFGRMMQSRYEAFLYNPDAGPVTQQYVQMDLMMPGERRVHYVRTSLGTDANFYRYVGAAPTIFTDPFGLDRDGPCTGWSRWPCGVADIASWVAIIPIPQIAVVASLVAIVGYAAGGDWTGVATASVGLALVFTGTGIVRGFQAANATIVAPFTPFSRTVERVLWLHVNAARSGYAAGSAYASWG